MNEPKFIRPQEWADALGLHRETIYLKLKSGELPGFLMGGQWYTRREDFDNWGKPKEVELA